jgi:phenylpropionate dioxygenase-like ring-hydroxylating dioxygenase large terminal subunit
MTDVVSPKHGGIDRTKAPEPALSDTLIQGERYYTPEFARKEWDKLWTKVWLIAGLESQLPTAGDYLTYEIGRESIIVSRGDDLRIRAFYNTWVPCEEDFPQGSPCGKRNLVEIPCDTWGGFVWINMDEGCDSLASYLAPIADQLECYNMANMKRTHWVTLEGDFNWKCVQDNFNESYHLPYVHPQTLASMNEHYAACQFDLYPSGHCRMFMPGGGPGPQYKGKPDRTLQSLGEDFKFWDLDPAPFKDNLSGLRVALQQRKRELGESRGFDFSNYTDEQLTDHYHYTVFPNVSFSMKPDGCIFLMGRPHPSGDPAKCLFDMWYLTLFPKGAKEYFSNSMRDWVSVDHQVEHQLGKAGEVSCGPGIDQDVAIWNTQQKGLSSRGYRGDYMPEQERRIRFFHDNIDRYINA